MNEEFKLLYGQYKQNPINILMTGVIADFAEELGRENMAKLYRHRMECLQNCEIVFIHLTNQPIVVSKTHENYSYFETRFIVNYVTLYWEGYSSYYSNVRVKPVDFNFMGALGFSYLGDLQEQTNPWW